MQIKIFSNPFKIDKSNKEEIICQKDGMHQKRYGLT